MKIVKGVVKYGAGAPREGQYGPSINILVTLEDQSQVRVYGKPGDVIERYKSGQNIQLIDDKGKYKVVEDEQAQASERDDVEDLHERGMVFLGSYRIAGKAKKPATY
jgi:hypothetical protein